MTPIAPPAFPPADHDLTRLGLRAAGVAAGIKASGKPDVALLVADAPLSVAGVFTQNLLAAAPVALCRAHLAASGGRMRALVVNSGNANACTGARGEADAAAMAAQVAALVGCPVHEVLVCSTGVIGVPLPMERVRGGLEAAYAALSADPAGGRAFLAAIQTTDAFPKEASEAVAGHVVAGVCKGAGMIQPDMATMLAFVGTTAAASPAALAAAIGGLAARSFNAVHVDTHTSTNDTFLFFSRPGHGELPADVLAGVERVSRRLAWLIARDGEGATKVTTLTVRGASSDEAARAVAVHVASSALVRTALFGNDPNWGRFVSQVGNSRAVKSIAGLRCRLQGTVVFEAGGPTSFDRAALSQAMRGPDVALEIELTEGAGEAVLLTADLGYEYVRINAEYTT